MSPTHSPLPPYVVHAQNIASFYGFRDIRDILRLRGTKHQRSTHQIPASLKDAHKAAVAGRLSAVTALMHSPGERTPLYLFTHSRARGRMPVRVELDIAHAPESVAEALLIRTALSILDELGYASLSIEINSVGTALCKSAFSRECGAYFRKHIDTLPPPLQDVLRRDMTHLFSLRHDAIEELLEEAPKPIDFLADDERTHFSEVLEYLEGMNVAYEINPRLMGRLPYSKTVFTIRSGADASSSIMLAEGGRYDELPRQFGVRKNVPSVGMTIFPEKDTPLPRITRAASPTRECSPRIALVHIGFEARLSALHIIEDLRRAHIPLYQNLTSERIGGQLSRAEQLGTPFTLIVGHKEALEQSAIVRDMESRSQETVPLKTLVPYLRKVLK